MPLRIEGDIVHLDGHCPAEDALPLQEFLLGASAPRIGMAECESLHTALFQVLIAAGAAVVEPPLSPLLARCMRDLSMAQDN